MEFATIVFHKLIWGA